LLQRLRSYSELTLYLLGQSVLRAMEYRAAFLFQVLGMFINNLCWLGCWYLFFLNFPEVNGWRFKDSALLLGFSCVSAGVMIAFFWGSFELSRTIYRGELDYYLGFPKNVLWHLSVSSGRMSGLGDILSGVLLCALAAEITLSGILLFFYLVLLSTLALYSFTIITRSFSFFVGNFESAADELFWSIITFGIYPSSAFHGVLKLLICTVVPAFFVFVLPVELLRDFSWYKLVLLTAVVIVMFASALAVFGSGLRRYESGSLIQTKV